jgi:hypothetical protein
MTRSKRRNNPQYTIKVGREENHKIEIKTKE